MMMPPLMMVKGDYFTGSARARIIRWLRVQDPILRFTWEQVSFHFSLLNINFNRLSPNCGGNFGLDGLDLLCVGRRVHPCTYAARTV